MKGITIELLFQEKGYFAENEAFAYWWSCIGKGLRLRPAQLARFQVTSKALRITDVSLYIKCIVQQPL